MEESTNENNDICKGYFGLYINSYDLSEEDKDAYQKVYKLAEDMRPLLKKYKAARFKYFDDFASAQTFAEIGCEGDSSWSADALYSEKQTPLKSISKQELMEFRKCIEDNNSAKVQTLVSQNPRYLVGPCAFPCILKEGPRYNALHVAAKARNAEIASLILKTVSDPYTYVRLYGQEANDKSNVKAASLLLDLYLNTPDKTLQETPLHFASKHAATSVVEVLISYPECQRDRPNKYNQTPLDIIGSREQNVPPEDIEKMRLLLTDPFYVPVLRSEDNSCQPIIGEPFSPTSPVCQNESGDIMSPKLEIKALAGPMAYNQAHMFKKQWKTPPRSFQDPSTPPRTPRSKLVGTLGVSPGSPTPSCSVKPPGSPVLWASPARRIILADLDRGLEKVGRCLAKEKNVGWKEYWSFLRDFVDLRSEEGLGKLEAYLKDRFEQEYFVKMVKNARMNMLKEMYGQNRTIGSHTSQEPVPSDNSDSSSSESGSESEDSKLSYSEKISRLCSKFEGLKLKSPETPPGKWNLFNRWNSENQDSSNLPNGSSWKLFEKWKSNGPECSDVTDNETPASSTHMPYLCVERSCQVFAKRIGDILLGNHSNNNSKATSTENMLKTYLMQEMKHINSLMDGYIDDSAFKNVKFSLLHHRLATRIVSYLISHPNRLDEVLKDLNILAENFSSTLMNICGTPPSRNSRSKLLEEEALNCVIQHCATILNTFLRKDSGDGSLSSNCPLSAESEIQSQWELSENCFCSFAKNSLSPKRNRNKVRSFASHRRTHSTSAFPSTEDFKSKSNSNGMLEESSESDEEWHDTVPAADATVTTMTRDDQEDDEAMSLTMQAPELYIDRSGPCKLDLDVLEAIENTNLDLVQFPMTNYWKFCIESHPIEDREKWRQRRKPDR